MDYQEKSQRLRAEGSELLDAWNRLIERFAPRDGSPRRQPVAARQPRGRRRRAPPRRLDHHRVDPNPTRWKMNARRLAFAAITLLGVPCSDAQNARPGPKRIRYMEAIRKFNEHRSRETQRSHGRPRPRR